MVNNERKPYQNFTLEQKKEILAFRETHSAKETALKFNLSSNTINTWRYLFKREEINKTTITRIRKPYQNFTNEERNKILTFREDHSNKETALKFGVAPQTISTWRYLLHKNGEIKSRGIKKSNEIDYKEKYEILKKSMKSWEKTIQPPTQEQRFAEFLKMLKLEN